MAMPADNVHSKWNAAALDRHRAMPDAEKLSAAKAMTFEEKLVLGGLLFDRECELLEQQIRDFAPQASDSVVRSLLQVAVAFLYEDRV